MAQYINTGKTVPQPAGSAVTAGDMVAHGSGLIGIAANDIAAGELGELEVEGNIRIDVESSIQATIAVGDYVEIDTGDNEVITADGGGDATHLVLALYPAAGSATECLVKLNQNAFPA